MLHTRKPVTLLTTAAALSLFVIGCSESKNVQCNKLTAIANQTVEEVQTIVQSNAVPNNAAFLEVAESFDRGKSAMQNVKLSDQQLETYRNRFIELYTEVGTSARNVGNAMSKQDFASARQAHNSFQSATGQEEPLVKEMNSYCEPTAQSN